MLVELRLRNFRGFDDHVVPLRDTTVLVGANNAGKSTVVEALRLVALVADRYRRGSGPFMAPPDWLNHPEAGFGIAPALRGQAADSYAESVFHRYAEPPAIIDARFSSSVLLRVFVGPGGEIHGTALDRDGSVVRNAAMARRLALPRIAIQPQVAPLLREEGSWQDETIRRGDGTHLAPQHFRNQLRLFSASYPTFKRIAEASWPGLQVRDLRVEQAESRRVLHLNIRDGDFVGEVSLMGHGLQMWLQTMWFLARAPDDAIVVLDEPDVYMHPDLQRRLLSLVRDRFAQLLMATHSIELISDVEPASILAIDRRRGASTFANDLPGVQSVIDELGGVHNIQVTRLLASRTFVLVEGKDVHLLRLLQRSIDSSAPPIDLVPHAELGGRGGWLTGLPRVVPVHNLLGQRIRVFAILDRDYFPDDEVEERQREAADWGIELCIWRCKELENHLLIPAVVSRVIADRLEDGTDGPSEDAVAEEVDRIGESMRAYVTDCRSARIYDRNKRAGVESANSTARRYVEANWSDRERRWALLPGKKVISELSRWCQMTWNVSFGPDQLAMAVKPSELDSAVADLIRRVSMAGQR